ncbi:MAG: S46 family peptidase, partial [Chitinophagaceae bacterium]
NGISPSLSEKERQSAIDQKLTALKQRIRHEAWEDVLIRPFFDGNKYYAFVTETYRDIRLVGAPPSSIGNFGKDTDNWMWPRHTGDFSLFRIYTGPDGRPAEYSANNKPMLPKRSLSISLDGVAENDFTMVFGFPGRTNEYLTSFAVAQIMNVSDPAKIGVREKALSVLNGYMRSDEGIKIQYASKYAGIENAYKKWKGEVLGLESRNIVAKKQAYEAEFQKRVNARPEWKTAYGTLLDQLKEAYAGIEPAATARDYYSEVTPRIELLAIAATLQRLVEAQQKGSNYPAALERARTALRETYAEFNPAVDRRMAEELLALYGAKQNNSLLPATLSEARGNLPAYLDRVYAQSFLDDSAATMRILTAVPEAAATAIKNDPAYQLMTELQGSYQQGAGSRIPELQARVNNLQRTYMKAQMEVFPERRFYPDANSTLRVTYGKAKAYQPRDGVHYGLYTYLDGVMEKYVPGDYEFDVPEKLRTLYRTKDFGQYGANGKQPVCFIGTNHTTGGNSGSPALDAYGNLVGLNFDRVWEGTMSDISYDPDICRNIMVDIRYVCFIIDKYAGATNIISELKFVHPKKGAAKKK